jgi:hypothetical protein
MSQERQWVELDPTNGAGSAPPQDEEAQSTAPAAPDTPPPLPPDASGTALNGKGDTA